MTDTSQEIKDLQLQIWLEKVRIERLRQSIGDNETLFKFWNNVKPTTKNVVEIYTKNQAKTAEISKN